ncbi:thioredoxin domain-containing protein [Empedobacter brevis]|uniref:thioredoxin domain-containing protein n=1 Tax=Empedobacter brevis TaxID=247 RepID=UPI003342D1C9
MITLTGIVNAQTATEILTKAQNQAKVENKNVFLIFHASWCGWCKKMEKKYGRPCCKIIF